jgi:uncharacterized membrane protein YhaH (DUF805 family)
MITCTIRRLHDIGLSGWWYLLTLVPFIGIVWFLYIGLKGGDAEDNEYGRHPFDDYHY